MIPYSSLAVITTMPPIETVVTLSPVERENAIIITLSGLTVEMVSVVLESCMHGCMILYRVYKRVRASAFLFWNI